MWLANAAMGSTSTYLTCGQAGGVEYNWVKRTCFVVRIGCLFVFSIFVGERFCLSFLLASSFVQTLRALLERDVRSGV